ncbi:zinc ribbon domain-containing protein [Geosporobacter ferrireducens]|uniref:DZANK-type domain-containing protein n=1 Tax=Geosporobacter ferrireducens TaxID=1424294 RepID=A0A1D8GE49_9FIRM|nr:zinc ribbon domain-containing protein [Geosporobacter ferrireducens]AOT69184.1 hypothetical protein Gferi_06165 [Geosporobacter ferrireducens]MTI56861.1 zinc ribbon domain-containing protein [Geosporobacter ferrireducens]
MTLLFLIVISILIYYVFIYRDNNMDFFSIKKVKRCPNCGNTVEKTFNVCPICKETLKKSCVNCGEKVDVFWKYCPYCEKEIEKGINE